MPDSLRFLRAELRPFVVPLTWSYVLSLGAVGVGLLLPWPFKMLIDDVLAGRGAPLAGAPIHLTPGGWVVALAAGFVFLTAIESWLGSEQRLRAAEVRERLTRQLRRRLLDHLHALPPAAGADRTGELVHRLVTDANLLARFLTRNVPIIIRHVTTSVLMLAIMVWMAPGAAVTGLVTIVPLALLVRHYGRQLQGAVDTKRTEEGAVAGLAQEIVRAVPTTQALGRERETGERFDRANETSLRAGLRMTMVMARMERTLRTGQGLAVALVMGMGGWLVLRGRLTVGELTVVMTYTALMLKPIEKVNDLASATARGLTATSRIREVLARVPLVRDITGAVPVASCAGLVEMHHIAFRYPTGNAGATAFALRDVSFRAEPGALTVITGPSGAGKSTILHLALRLLDPDAGEVRLDGRLVREIRLRDLRAQFAVVRQDTHLFAGSWRDALRLDDRATDDAMWEALSRVALDRYVQGLRGGLDAPIDENGDNLSGGQRRRLALARALVVPRPILLLDEPLAHVDAASAEIILDTIQACRAARTCLAVSHHRGLMARADRVYRLNDGRLTVADAAYRGRVEAGIR